jgi:hypothetical protein
VAKYFEQFENTKKPFLYITVDESSTLMEATRKTLGQRFFCLREKGRHEEWKRFVKAVLDSLKG